MEKLFYSIGEVAEILGENTSLIRFWSNSFRKYVNPRRNAKGNRMYTAEDIGTFKQIHYLVKDKGMTLEGAQLSMKADRSSIDARVRAIDTLKEIRAQLVEVRKTL